MKKVYKSPLMTVVEVELQPMMVGGSDTVTQVETDSSVGIQYGGASTLDTSGEGPRSRGRWFGDD